MIERFAAYIDQRLQTVSGKVFYSGRKAFSQLGSVYVLGANPGGDPDTHAAETIGSHTDFVCTQAPAHWSAYTDEAWLGWSAGTAPLQRRLAHLLQGHMGLDVRSVPASNLVFSRSRNVAALDGDWRALLEACWPVHQAVLDQLQPRAVICLGVDTGQQLVQRLGGGPVIGRFREQNARGWESLGWRVASGMMVFGLTHPGRVDWTNPVADPGPMVRSLLVP